MLGTYTAADIEAMPSENLLTLLADIIARLQTTQDDVKLSTVLKLLRNFETAEGKLSKFQKTTGPGDSKNSLRENVTALEADVARLKLEVMEKEAALREKKNLLREIEKESERRTQELLDELLEQTVQYNAVHEKLYKFMEARFLEAEELRKKQSEM